MWRQGSVWVSEIFHYFLRTYTTCNLGDLWRHCGGLGIEIVMPYPINQRAHQFNSIQSVPVSFGLWDTALKFPSPGPRSDVTDHLEQTEPTRKESHIYGIWADWRRQRQIYIKSKQWWKYWNPLMWRKFNFWMVLWWAPDLAKFLPNLLTAWSRYTNTPARIVICI